MGIGRTRRRRSGRPLRLNRGKGWKQERVEAWRQSTSKPPYIHAPKLTPVGPRRGCRFRGGSCRCGARWTTSHPSPRFREAGEGAAGIGHVPAHEAVEDPLHCDAVPDEQQCFASVPADEALGDFFEANQNLVSRLRKGRLPAWIVVPRYCFVPGGESSGGERVRRNVEPVGVLPLPESRFHEDRLVDGLGLGVGRLDGAEEGRRENPIDVEHRRPESKLTGLTHSVRRETRVVRPVGRRCPLGIREVPKAFGMAFRASQSVFIPKRGGVCQYAVYPSAQGASSRVVSEGVWAYGRFLPFPRALIRPPQSNNYDFGY